jgi:hypothetical protein
MAEKREHAASTGGRPDTHSRFWPVALSNPDSAQAQCLQVDDPGSVSRYWWQQGDVEMISGSPFFLGLSLVEAK